MAPHADDSRRLSFEGFTLAGEPLRLGKVGGCQAPGHNVAALVRPRGRANWTLEGQLIESPIEYVDLGSAYVVAYWSSMRSDNGARSLVGSDRRATGHIRALEL